MLEVLLLILYAASLSYAFGVTSILVIMKIAGEHEPWHMRSPLVVVIGFATISLIISCLHFFIPIDWRCHLFVWLILLALVFSNKKELVSVFPDLMYRIRKSMWFNLLLLCIALISVTIKPGTGDIADYHLQAIKWAEHYKNLPGIGNFNRPLVNNNWWFNLQAFFGLHDLGLQSVYVLNGLWYLLLMIYFARNVGEHAQRLFRVPVIIFLILTVKTAFIGSVTPDIVITGIIFLCFDLYLESNAHQSSKGFYTILIALLIFWGITIKATALLLLLLTGIMVLSLYKHKHFFKYVLLIAGIGGLWLLPWFAGNVVRGGYLLYPFNQVDLFHVDWKVPASYFEYDKIVLKGWGRINYADIYQTVQMPLTKWVPIWFSNLDVFNKAIIIGFVLAIISLCVKLYQQKQYIVPFIAALVGFAMLFNSGPHMRFMYGYIIVTIGLALSQYPLPAVKWARKAYMAFLALMTLLLVIKNHEQLSLLKPNPYPQHTLQKSTINGFEVYLVNSNNLCWDQFPCTYYIAHKTVLRSADINDGFRVEE